MILRQLKEEICLKPITTITTNEETNVPANVETTILTLSATTDHKISRISVSGDDYAKIRLYIDTNLVETKRSGPERSVDFLFDSPLELNNTQVLDIKVLHCYTGVLSDFEATVYSRI